MTSNQAPSERPARRLRAPGQETPGQATVGIGCRRLAWALVLALPLAGAACSSTGRSAAPAADQAGATGEEDYPNLSRVPGEAPRPTPESLRKELIEGLVADHANAHYTGELLTASSATPPPAAPPPAAKAQVEITWDTPRVLPEGESQKAGEGAESGSESGDGAGAAGAAAGQPETAAGGEEEVRITWDTERVAPSGKVTVAGQGESQEELMLTPQPELVAVVYFDKDSSQVGVGDHALLEQVVALYKERGGHLRLIGHSGGQTGTGDEVAQRMVNLDLSLQRANAVATTLVDLGAEKDNLMVEAKADGELADGTAAVGDEINNRRVEIYLEH